MIRVSVYHRKDDWKHPWWLSYRLPQPDGTTRRVRQPAAHSKVVAERVARAREIALNAGRGLPEQPTVTAFVDEFLKATALTRAKNTLVGYSLTCNRFKEVFGAQPLLAIGSAQVRAYLQSRAHLAPATRRRELRELSAAFSIAVSWGHLQENPCAGIRAPRVPHGVSCAWKTSQGIR